jgi:hypothetical protein
MRATFILVDEHVRTFALKAVRMAKLGLQVKIGKPDRNEDQNRLLHALLSDISDQLAWPPDTGELHTLDWYKRSLTLQWLIETKQEYEVITALEGQEFGILLPHTSDLSTEQCASLCEFIMAFGTLNKVKWSERKRAPEPPPEAYR